MRNKKASIIVDIPIDGTVYNLEEEKYQSDEDLKIDLNLDSLLFMTKNK